MTNIGGSAAKRCMAALAAMLLAAGMGAEDARLSLGQRFLVGREIVEPIIATSLQYGGFGEFALHPRIPLDASLALGGNLSLDLSLSAYGYPWNYPEAWDVYFGGALGASWWPMGTFRNGLRLGLGLAAFADLGRDASDRPNASLRYDSLGLVGGLGWNFRLGRHWALALGVDGFIPLDQAGAGDWSFAWPNLVDVSVGWSLLI